MWLKILFSIFVFDRRWKNKIVGLVFEGVDER